jgi:hypothetical protein
MYTYKEVEVYIHVLTSVLDRGQLLNSRSGRSNSEKSQGLRASVDHITNRTQVRGRSTHNLFSVLTEVLPVNKGEVKLINTKRKQTNI